MCGGDARLPRLLVHQLTYCSACFVSTQVVELGFAAEAQVANNQEANNFKRPLIVTFEGFGAAMSAGSGMTIGTEFVPWGGDACVMEVRPLSLMCDGGAAPLPHV
jgi:hypothetical protein